MKLQYTLLLLTITVLTSCTSTSIREQEELLGINETAIEVSTSVIEDEVLDAVNAHREEIGLTTLEFSSEAYQHADVHNDYMIKEDKISHDNFGSRAQDVAASTGAIMVSENVARHFSTATQVVTGWLNSPSHRNTMEGDFTHTTISVKADENGRLYFTQLFFKK